MAGECFLSSALRVSHAHHYVLRNKFLEQKYLKGEVGIELVPQGTLVARLKAHASGYPAVLTPTGAYTAVERGEIPIRYNPGGMDAGVAVPGSKKEAMEFSGRRYVVEPALAGDVAFVHAWKADEVGNLVFRYGVYENGAATRTHASIRYTANNYNAVMARNAKLTIVEAEEIVYVMLARDRATP